MRLQKNTLLALYSVLEFAAQPARQLSVADLAADVIKLAMVQLQRALDTSKLRTQLLLQVHDEVILEVPEEELDAARDLVVRELSSVVDLAVPLDVDTAYGLTWFDAQKH